MPYSYDRWLGIFYMHYHLDMITHGWPCWTSRRHWSGQVDNMLIDFHLSETNGLCRAQTWAPRLTDANYYAISPPLIMLIKPCIWKLWQRYTLDFSYQILTSLIMALVCVEYVPKMLIAIMVMYNLRQFWRHLLLFYRLRIFPHLCNWGIYSLA